MAIERKDPFHGFNFAVELDGITQMGFRACAGLDTASTSSPYREGTDQNLAPRQLPGLLGYSNIVLSRGVTDDKALWSWREEIAKGTVTRRNVSIILRDIKGEEKIRWNIKDAWPVKWSGPAFDATSEAVAIESLELAHEGIEVAKWQK
jgi:phage tail-like protein